jgi:Tat protein secretion system quality control protein TatD with DNase activity
VKPVYQAVTPTDVFPEAATEEGGLFTSGLHPWYIEKFPNVTPYVPPYMALSQQEQGGATEISTMITKSTLLDYCCRNMFDYGSKDSLDAGDDDALRGVSGSVTVRRVISTLASAASQRSLALLSTVHWYTSLVNKLAAGGSNVAMLGEMGVDKLVYKRDKKSYDAVVKSLADSGGYYADEEIGDLVEVCDPANVQVVVFVLQLLLASEHAKPISMHSLKSVPLITNIFEYLYGTKKLAVPKGIVWHSFSGDLVDYRSISELFGRYGSKERVFYGYSSAISGKSKSKGVFKSIPEAQVLLESDVIEEHDQKASLLKGVEELGEVWGKERTEVVEIVNCNWEKLT